MAPQLTTWLMSFLTLTIFRNGQQAEMHRFETSVPPFSTRLLAEFMGYQTDDVRCAIGRRILVAQALYAVGAAMCLVNTYVSIGFIVFVQLNFAIAPRIFRLNRF